eukprot:13162696-Alexandrium_andersonii.AAC.1
MTHWPETAASTLSRPKPALRMNPLLGSPPPPTYRPPQIQDRTARSVPSAWAKAERPAGVASHAATHSTVNASAGSAR